MQLIGIPFVWGGRDIERDGGLDCWGLVRLVRPEVPDYEADNMSDAAIVMRKKAGDWARVMSPQVGDIVLMGRSSVPHHAGILTEAGVLHTQRKTGSVIQSLTLLRRPFLYPLMRFYRWPQ